MRRGSGITLLTVIGVLLAAVTAFGVNSRVLDAKAASVLGSASQLLPAEQAAADAAASEPVQSATPASTGVEGADPVSPTAGPQDPGSAPVAAAEPDSGQGGTATSGTSNASGDAARPAGAGGPRSVITSVHTGGRVSPASVPSSKPSRSHTDEPENSGRPTSSSHTENHGSTSPTPSSSEHHDGGSGSGSGSGGGGSHPSDD